MNAGSVTVNVSPNTSDLERMLRIIAKHAQACADELAQARIGVAS